MVPKIWIDGKIYDKSDARASVYDHGLLYGDGVFEGIRVYNGRIFESEAHVRRLYESAKAIRLTIPLSPQEFLAATQQTISATGANDCYIRALVTRGPGCLGLSPLKCPQASVIIIVDTIELYPPQFYQTGIAVITSSLTRTPPNSLSPRVKSLNYLNNILAKIEANDAGVPEAVMLNHMGNVAECTGDNIFIIRNGTVMTPAATEGILEGITRGVILRLCGKLNIPCEERVVQRHDLYVADECFLTGTGAEVIPVTRIDGRTIGTGTPGPITLRLIEEFHHHVRQA
jgi:branched-chain amino acid aminotransferase